MSEFSVDVVRISKIEKHPNADRLDLAYIGEYIAIVGRDQYNAGDLVVYVPEAAIVPDWMLRRMGLWDEASNRGKLRGSKGNIVKAQKIRDVLSQGLVFPVEVQYPSLDKSKPVYGIEDGSAFDETINAPVFHVVNEGDNIAVLLGIEKWTQPIPTSMSGQVANVSSIINLFKFDLENFKKYPNLIKEGDWVEITEKLHGTFMGVCVTPGSHPDLWNFHFDGVDYVAFPYSKGLGKQNLAFKNSPENNSNIYVRMFKEKFLPHIEMLVDPANSMYYLGEVFGKGVQDLSYNTEAAYRMFSIREVDITSEATWEYSYRGMRYYIEKNTTIDVVPLLYEGPFSTDLRKLRDGKSTLADHIREGIVIKCPGRKEPRFGDVILKDVSEAYLLRKNGSEYQ